MKQRALSPLGWRAAALLALVIWGFPCLASAATTYTLTAADAGAGLSFTVVYEDLTGDGLYNPAPGNDNTLDFYGFGGPPGAVVIVNSPVNSLTSPLTNGIGAQAFSPPLPDYWEFYYDGAGNAAVPASMWTYSQVQAAPVPPTVILLGTALLGLAVARRRKPLGG
jgi:hypothetical protein